jgi:Mg2+ and Co2+ transporter CorA
MAEAFAVFTGIVGLLDVAVRTADSLRELYSEVKNAPNLIWALSNDITDFKDVLEDISSARESIEKLAHPQDSSMMNNLERRLQNAQEVLSELDSLVTRLNELKSSTKRIAWYLQKAKAEALRNRLKETKAQLVETLISYGV